MKAIQIRSHGGPEVLEYTDIETPAPGTQEVLVRLHAVGVNYIDTYHRTGLYPVSLPYVPGLEGAGVVEQLGEGVENVSVGDRVTYTGVPGSYAEYAVVPAERLVQVPNSLDFRSAAAAMLQGMTAHYLSHSTYPISDGDRVLVHAAAGGVGLLLVQMAKMRGATVYGTVSTAEKAELAARAGADEVIRYSEVDFEEKVRELTGGAGVQAVYDSVGEATFLKSLNCLAKRGTMVSFGQSSGKISPLDPTILAQKGSLYLTRPMLFDYIADRESLEERASTVFDWIGRGKVSLRVKHVVPLDQAADAHRSLEGRETTGKVVLEP
jgi:NADPH2:quinone reductase